MPKQRTPYDLMVQTFVGIVTVVTTLAIIAFIIDKNVEQSTDYQRMVVRASAEASEREKIMRTPAPPRPSNSLEMQQRCVSVVKGTLCSIENATECNGFALCKKGVWQSLTDVAKSAP